MNSSTALRFLLPCRLLGILLLPLATAGCDLAGVAATAFPPKIDAAYAGLTKQSVCIMVWADHGIVIDHPSVQADLAKGLQDKLQQAMAAGADELKLVQFYSSDDVLRFQENHPEAESDTPDVTARKFPATRMIYVELTDLSLHPNEAIDLSRGTATTSLRVIETDGGKSKTAYEEVNISVVYPPKAPPEGITGLMDDSVYHQTIDEMTSALAERFFSHEADAVAPGEQTPPGDQDQ